MDVLTFHLILLRLKEQVICLACDWRALRLFGLVHEAKFQQSAPEFGPSPMSPLAEHEPVGSTLALCSMLLIATPLSSKFPLTGAPPACLAVYM